MADLNTDVRFIKGIGEKKALALQKLGVRTLYDLVSFFPRAYEDRSQYKPIGLLMPDETACVRAMVATEPRLSRVRRGMELVKFKAVDDSGTLDVTFFNQSYVRQQLRVGESYVFYGKCVFNGARREMTNPVYEREDAPGGVTGRIVPVYRLTAGLSQRVMMAAVRQGLDECGELLPEALPAEIADKYRLCQARYAYENIHFPADFGALELSRRRLIFEELFVLSCALGILRGSRTAENGIVLKRADIEEFYAALPFTPTSAQRRAVSDAIGDMRSGQPMNRLVQGDVGSGKTMVAAAAAFCAANNGKQTALMAPTEILAEQHYASLQKLFEPLNISVDLLTGSMSVKQKKEARERLASGQTTVIVGTHALLTDSTQFLDLGLVIADEQHRFGVAQRSKLSAKGEDPHLLVMSATPIPRTLALLMYGDLDVSILDELPPGRETVDTFLVGESYRPRINAFIRKQVSEGHQCFVVCPAVEENQELGIKAASAWADTLQQTVFPDLRIALLHGQMKGAEKEEAMAAFARGEADVMVATTVIEVGVDVPNATLMVIEDADRFGLSQLHQLRGRVGRGKAKSYCILTTHNRNPETLQRLKALCKTTDGFRIAEEDLKLRGPGDFFGSRQSGLPAFRVADLSCDLVTLKDAQTASARWIEDHGTEDTPEANALRERIGELFARSEGTMN